MKTSNSERERGDDFRFLSQVTENIQMKCFSNIIIVERMHLYVPALMFCISANFRVDLWYLARCKHGSKCAEGESL